MSDPNTKPQSFAVTLATIDGGAFNDQLSREVQELIGDMSNHAMVSGGVAKGKIAITIDLLLEKGVFEIAAEKKLSHPKERKTKSIFWADKNNNLTEENPRQTSMQFGENVERMNRPAS